MVIPKESLIFARWYLLQAFYSISSRNRFKSDFFHRSWKILSIRAQRLSTNHLIKKKNMEPKGHSFRINKAERKGKNKNPVISTSKQKSNVTCTTGGINKDSSIDYKNSIWRNRPKIILHVQEILKIFICNSLIKY